MSANKKPRKKYNPAKRKADAFGGIRALYKASALNCHDPMDADQLRDLAIGYHGALHAIVTGQGSHNDTNTLAMASNITLLLCEIGVGREHLEVAKAGQEAVVLLMMRHRTQGRCVATGPELKALQELLELHDAQLESPDCTQARMTAVLDECRRRIRERHVLEVVAA